MIKRNLLLITCLFMLFFTTASAADTQSNWQTAYKDNDATVYFDTNTVKTIGSPDILSVDLKTDLSQTMLQEIMTKYKASYDTANWNKIKYSVIYTVYNQKDKTLLSKNYRFFDGDNNLIATINDENKSVVSANSIQSKTYAAIFEWLYEN
ncbi:hypothetical protein SAMN05660742_102249 [Propionispira arboris]|uniref:Secreted protein n=1 Tax=Propionispira arboris TaxID=84035 RepID=A0A1H6VFX3_9FIRM|nr:hypothetical protein [Propionispira arboris]SEJ00677.1 hypothetical protein SAMN05660742_102249 [Propionispira arboris]